MKNTSFAAIGARTKIYQYPHEDKDLEGEATVMAVHDISDFEMAFVDVLFDDDGENGDHHSRWILPRHLIVA